MILSASVRLDLTGRAVYGMAMLRAILAVFLALPLHAEPETPQSIAKEILAPMLAPANVDTLRGSRPINARAYRVLHWLETARGR